MKEEEKIFLHYKTVHVQEICAKYFNLYV